MTVVRAPRLSRTVTRAAIVAAAGGVTYIATWAVTGHGPHNWTSRAVGFLIVAPLLWLTGRAAWRASDANFVYAISVPVVSTVIYTFVTYMAVMAGAAVAWSVWVAAVTPAVQKELVMWTPLLPVLRPVAGGVWRAAR